MKFYLVIIMLVLQHIHVVAQQPFTKQFTDEEGLPSMTIYFITQDKDGFLWLGTDNGVCRFDGKSFKTIPNPNGSDNEFIGLHYAQNGILWAWNLSGELYKVFETGLQRYQPTDYSKEILINNLISDNQGNIYLSHHNWKGRHFTLCNNQDSCYEVEKKNGLAEFATFITPFQSSSSFINLRNNQYNAIYKNTPSMEILANRGYFQDTRYTYFPSSFNRIIAHNYSSKHIFSFKTTSSLGVGIEDIDILRNNPNIRLNFIRVFYQDKDGYYWIGDDKHLYQLDELFQVKRNLSNLLINLSLNHFFQDAEGGYWLGTNSNGLFYIPSFDLKTFSDQSLPLRGGQIVSIEPLNEKEIVIATQTGDIFRIKNNKIIDYKFYSGSLTLFKKASDNSGFWLNAYNKLLKLDNQLNISKDYGLSSSLKDLVQNDEKIYVATQSSLISFPSRANKLKGKTKKELIKERANAVAQTSSNEIWAGTTNGLYRVKGDSVSLFWDRNYLEPFNIWVTTILESKDSSLWVATKNNGLYNILNGNIRYHFDLQDGLTSNQCENLFLDDYNQLWIGTLKGVNILDLSTLMFTKIDRTNGLPSSKIHDIFIQNKDVWISTSKGLTFFEMDKVTIDTPRLPIVFQEVKIDGIKHDLQSNYKLNLKNNTISFGFVSPSYKHQGDLIYSYRMVGLDEEWKFTSNNTVQYDRLRPGHYQFKVRACLHEGDKSGIVTGIDIKINRPIYTQIWFYVVLIIILAAAGGGIFMLWLSFYQKRQEKEAYFNRQFSELKIAALQSQMNPHFIFNALNAIQNFFLTNEREAAMIYLAKFARLIRLIFEYSKLSTVTLNQELNFLKLYLQLEKLRFGEKIAINLIGDEIVDKEYILLPPLLIQPVIENALKHGLLHKEKDGELTVKFEKINEKMLRVLVLDNGIGRAQAKKYGEWKPKEYKSSGVNTIEERVRLINHEAKKTDVQFYIRDLTDEYKQPIGTKVEFIFKIRRMINEYDDE